MFKKMTIVDYIDNTDKVIFNTDKLIIGKRYQVRMSCCVPLDCVLIDISDNEHSICFHDGHETLYVSIYDVLTKRVELFIYIKGDIVQLLDITSTTKTKFKIDSFVVGDVYYIEYSNPYDRHIMNKYVCMVNKITEDTVKFKCHNGTFVTFTPSTATELILKMRKLS